MLTIIGWVLMGLLVWVVLGLIVGIAIGKAIKTVDSAMYDARRWQQAAETGDRSDPDSRVTLPMPRDFTKLPGSIEREAALVAADAAVPVGE